MGLLEDQGGSTLAGVNDVPVDEKQNTDTHLWPPHTKGTEPYDESIHVTAGGGIGIDVCGHVIVRSLREWHALAAKDWEETLAKWREAQ